MADKLLKYILSGVLILLSALLAFATYYEKVHGAEIVHSDIYGTIWFAALWAAVGVLSVIYIFRRRLYKQRAVFTLHCSFAVILLGAGITFLTADRGYMHIRQGETLNTYISEADEMPRKLPFDVKLVLFDIEYHPGTYDAADFISFLKVDEEICRVSMNKIYREAGYRLYQLSYDEDEMGTILQVNRDTWGISVTYIGYLLLAISTLWLLWLKIGWIGMLWTLFPTAAMWVYISQTNPMTPILRTPLLAAHVSVIMVSYGIFVYIFFSALISLFIRRTREKVYRVNLRLLYPAIFLLAAGIFIGAVWANISWGRYWGWDAKETWALITLMVYAVPLHKGSIKFLRCPQAFNVYCVFATLAMLMTFFGVTYFLGGIHSYI